MTDSEEESPESTKVIVKKPVDLQRMKLEKLMKNPEKPAFIPEMHKNKRFPDAPEFVRNVMGSSAGAGSGEFHVYRHIRRREYARNLYLHKANEKNILDEEYHEKLEQNQKESELKTAKKRKKRQRLKMNKRGNKNTMKKQMKNSDSEGSLSEASNSSESDARNETES